MRLRNDSMWDRSPDCSAYARIPSRFPTLLNTSSAWSSSVLVWVAVTMVRTRALPFGTVGADAGCQHAVLEQRAREIVRQLGFAHDHRGDGVSLLPVRKPAAINPCLKYLVLFHRA